MNAPDRLALFDSARAALRFAFNHSSASIKPPTMSRAMSEGADPDAKWIELPTKRSPRPGSENLRGLDGAGQAGMILQEFDKLPIWPRLALVCRALAPRVACSCKNPCCSGFRLNKDWSAAVDALCFVLKEEAELSKRKGKRGLSTDPGLRRAIVMRFFDPSYRFVLRDMAEAARVSERTVIVHKEPIEAFLDDQEKQGWQQLDELLQTCHIVGAQ